MTAGTKERKTLRGLLLRPLSVGSRAIIVHQSNITRTSPIVAIHGRTASAVRFETMDTRYYLLTGPDTEPAVGLLPAALAA